MRLVYVGLKERSRGSRLLPFIGLPSSTISPRSSTSRHIPASRLIRPWPRHCGHSDRPVPRVSILSRSMDSSQPPSAGSEVIDADLISCAAGLPIGDEQRGGANEVTQSRGDQRTWTAFCGLRQKICLPRVSRHQSYLFSILHPPQSPPSSFTFIVHFTLVLPLLEHMNAMCSVWILSIPP